MTPSRDEHVFRARRTLVGAALLAALVLAAGVVAAVISDDPASRRGTTPVAGPPPTTVVPGTHPVRKTASFEQARAVEQIRKRMPYVAVAGRQHREIAITFDDGPGPYTQRVLRVLDRLHAPATFFQVGNQIQSFPEAEEAELRDPGVLLANHTWAHKNLAKLSRGDQADQLDWASYAIRKAGGNLPQLFRPPYGAFNRTTLTLTGERHLLMVMWTIDSQDYERPGTKAIVKRVVDQARPGAIVLMHDAGGDRKQTVAALPAIIKQLRAKHYKLVTVPRLLKDNPPPLEQPRIEPGVG